MNKPTFRQNNYGVKSSCDQYRNIKCIHYICWASDPSEFETLISEAKGKGLKTKIIKGELYVEKK